MVVFQPHMAALIGPRDAGREMVQASMFRLGCERRSILGIFRGRTMLANVAGPTSAPSHLPSSVEDGSAPWARSDFATSIIGAEEAEIAAAPDVE
jgi:hypothetical protein